MIPSTFMSAAAPTMLSGTTWRATLSSASAVLPRASCCCCCSSVAPAATERPNSAKQGWYLPAATACLAVETHIGQRPRPSPAATCHYQRPPTHLRHAAPPPSGERCGSRQPRPRRRLPPRRCGQRGRPCPGAPPPPAGCPPGWPAQCCLQAAGRVGREGRQRGRRDGWQAGRQGVFRQGQPAGQAMEWEHAHAAIATLNAWHSPAQPSTAQAQHSPPM